YPIELVEIDYVPGYRGIRLQTWLSLPTSFINRRVDFFELTTHRILNNLRPGLISLAKRNSVGMTWSTVSAKRFIGHFSNMLSTHHHGNARSTNGIGDVIGARHHPSHGADADESDPLLANEAH